MGFFGCIAQDSKSQQHAGRFPADAARSELAGVDRLQVVEGEPLPGKVDVGQMVADDLADQGDF